MEKIQKTSFLRPISFILDADYLNEKISTANKEPEYETLPRLQDEKTDKKGLFRFSKNTNKKPDIPPVYASINKDKQQCTSATKDPHYEELPLPDENQINKWKEQSNDRSNNEEQSSKENDNNGKFNQGLNTQIPDKQENAHELPKNATYEDIPPLKDEKKRKGIFRFSRAFKNNNSKDSQEESKTDHKNSTNSDKFSSQNETVNFRQSMLNPRDKVKKDDPAHKYPFYEELPPIRDPKRTESVFAAQLSNEGEQEKNSSSPYYHVLETNAEQGCGKHKTENKEEPPHYFILEKVCLKQFLGQLCNFIKLFRLSKPNSIYYMQCYYFK